MSFSVSSSQEWSTILSIESLKMSYAAFTINKKITKLAIESITGNPILAPAIPTNAPIEENASERWCHASAIKALESIRFALILVYQYIPSLLTIEIIAATRANIPGTCKSL